MNGGDNSERGDRGDKSGSGAEAVRKRRRDKDGLRTGLSGSAWERDWVVGSQILTFCHFNHLYSCYVWILKESGCGWGQKVGGWKHVWLIAIDYHAATGTAGMGYRRDRRSKVASQPALWCHMLR